MIILVFIATDHPQNEYNKLVTFENQQLLATGNHPDHNEAKDASIQCAEVTGKRAWLSDDG